MQGILPAFILGHTPMWMQILFFGALLSAILSTASGAIIAPTALVTENVIRPFYPRMTDRQFLVTLRVALVSFTLAALVFALLSKKTMYDMIQNAYTVTLVSAFVPLAGGIFWKRATNAGAIVSALSGLAAWMAVDALFTDPTIPSPLAGLALSTAGLVLGSLVFGARRQAQSAHGEPG
jgi:Na+/proline symporter